MKLLRTGEGQRYHGIGIVRVIAVNHCHQQIDMNVWCKVGDELSKMFLLRLLDHIWDGVDEVVNDGGDR